MDSNAEKKISWLANKPLNWERVKEELSESLKLNQMTNGGPCVRRLEEALRILLKVKSRKSVIAVCNGCAALHALTSAAELFHGMTLRFATQSYTFPASCQGTLRGCRIVDTNTKLGPDLIELDLAKSEIDGIIVTNVLGNVTDLQEYEDWCRKNDKLLFLDNAATSCTTFKGSNSVNLGQGAIVSLHHTKPIGFGEGGVIIADAEYEQFIRQVINFGYDMVKMNQEWRPQGSNYKMSEVSAAFILQYLDGFSLLRQIHQNLYVYFKTKLQPFEGRISLAYDASDDIPIVSCFCLFFPFDVTSKHLELVRSRGIECRKYYKPLTLSGNAYEMYKRNLCLPCHSDMTNDDVDRMIDVLQMLLK